MTSKLAIQAVKNACLNVKDIEGILLHSDLRVQYTSYAFETCLKEREILHSFSPKGNPYDNACIESWYNRKRIHSAINYLTSQAAHDAT